MELTCSIYSQNAFKECVLPAVNNTDYTITLRKDEFLFQNDLKLRFLVIDNKWKITADPGYSIIYDKRVYPEIALHDQQILNIHTANGEAIAVIISESHNAFHDFSKFSTARLQRITIGRDESSDIRYDFMSLVSRHHACISFNGARTVIQNLSPNGIYVNSRRIEDETVLKFGDFINIIGLHMVFLGEFIAIDTANSRVKINNKELMSGEQYEKERTSILRQNRRVTVDKHIYHRAPRTYESVSKEPIEIEAPPQFHEQKKQSLLMLIAPSITMSLPMILGSVLMISAYSKTGGGGAIMYTGLIMAVSSAIIGVSWALINVRNQRKEEAETEKLRQEKYGKYLIEKADEVKKRYDDMIKLLSDMYPDPDECLSYDEEGGLLWNRNSTHNDFLTHRLGLGDIPFPVEIKIPQKHFTLEEDKLADKTAFIKENYQTLYQVPITVDISRHKLIGIIGGPGKKNGISIARTLSTQIAAGNCYTDVKMGFLYEGESSSNYGEWDFAKWLPHVWSEDRKSRFVASNANEASEVLFELTSVFRDREEHDNSNSTDKALPKPYYVIFVSDQSFLEGESFANYMTKKDPACGLTTILIAESYEQLPNSCDYIIECTDEFQGSYGVYGSKESKQSIKFDNVDKEQLEKFTRRISSLRVIEMEEGGEIPNSLTFFEMLHINRPSDINVRELWARNKTYENIKGQIGVKAGSAPCYLDVHEKYHGPHGLVAGTTGSGKSETLQSYILSLAINYSPDDIGFFIIDYKGGGMANLFNGLPHLVGQISNLSGNQVRRAMISIKSENRRRQQIFNDSGVNNINGYTKLYKNGEVSVPVPHLFIIIDEFAELKREEPEFMRELISVAQVGRSLGVHLILATQKPSGTVDDNIWSNSKFRLCLRVQDKQDSMDMLHRPDAAYITQAGRCYLQVGNDEVFELFQSGYSGAPYDENIEIGATDIAKIITTNGKVDMVGNSLKQRQKKAVETVWVKTLIEAVKESSSRYGIEAGDAVSDDSSILTLIHGIYEYLYDNGTDYPESRYNTARLKDFIHMYADSAEKLEGTPNANYILDLASTESIKLPEVKGQTELDAVRDYLGTVAKESGYKHQHQLWLPVLKETMYLDDFPEFKNNEFSAKWGWRTADKNWNMKFVMGQFDDPANQNQMTMVLDFARDGNFAICGSVVSGKSTSLQTLLYSVINLYSPEAVNIYALDFGSKMTGVFEEAPHTGAVMFENDLDEIGKFFNMMLSILKERKNLMRGGSFKQYVKVSEQPMPAIIIAIDNYAGFKEKTGEKYEDIVIQISKEGLNLGIFLVITGTGFGINDITARVAENLNTVLTLSLPDKYAYGDLLHTSMVEVLPEAGVKGRGLALYDNRILEYQTALAVKADNDFDRMELIKKRCRLMKENWTGITARPVPHIPKKPEWTSFSQLQEYKRLIQTHRMLPVGYNAENADIYGIDLSRLFCYGVYGERSCGKTNFMKACILAAADQESEICIFDDPNEQLAEFSGREGLTYCNDDESVFRFFGTLLEEFKTRNVRKNQLIDDGCGEDEVFDAMNKEFKPIFIMISDLSWFISMLYDTEYDMRGFVENILSKGSSHNIYIFAEMSLDKKSEISGYQEFDLFTKYRTGIHFGGKAIDNSILSYDYLSFGEQSKSEKPGVGLLPDRNDPDDPWRIIIPRVSRSAVEN